jgi:hypothetical protein
MAERKKGAARPPELPSMQLSGEEMFNFLLGDMVSSMSWTTRDGWEEIAGKDCLITMEPRPYYCDRGNFLMKLHPRPGSKLALDVDGQDGWPRYYFDKGRAKREVEAWLRKRGQWLDVY